jgi:hypothetical protein
MSAVFGLANYAENAGTSRFSRPNVDEDRRTAVRYEPAAAYESAQNRATHFVIFSSFTAPILIIAMLASASRPSGRKIEG